MTVNSKNKSLDKNLQYEKKDIELLLQEIGDVVLKLNFKLAEHDHSLDKSIKQLMEENYVLSKLPAKVEEYINKIIPKISIELYKQLLLDLDQGLDQRSKRIDELNERARSVSTNVEYMLERVQDVISSVKIFQDGQIKKKMISFFIFTVTMVILSSATSYLMMKNFPTRVWLTAGGDVHIDKSSVIVRKPEKK